MSSFANEASDPRFLIDASKITATQIVVFTTVFLMNMLDGMDVLVISYAAPVLSTEWGIAPQALGIVFSSGLLGMAVGGMFLASQADRIGRRAMILICIVVMGGSVLFTASAQTLTHLILLRFISGLGIGSMLATAATMAAEYAPDRQRNLIVSTVMSGYPLGATLSGVAAAYIIPAFGWRAMFLTAGTASLITFPVAWHLLPESLEFLTRVRPRNALARINAIMTRMKLAPLDQMPPKPSDVETVSVKTLFVEHRAQFTTLFWLAFFMSFATLYFLTSWIPNLAASTGMSVELAIYAGTVFNLGAFLGIVSQGYLSQTFGLRRTIAVFMIVSALFMAVFGAASGSYVLLMLFGLIGYASQGGFVGLYTVGARLYPTEIRTTGVGWGVGAGRFGAILGPAIGGGLIGMGLSIGTNFLIFAVPMVLAGIFTMMIRSDRIS